MRRWVYRHWRCALRLLRGFCPEPILCFLRIYSSSVDCRWLHIRQYAGSSVKGGTADGRSGTSSWQGQRSGRAITSARRRRRSQVRRPPTQAHGAAALSRNVLVASNVRPLLVVLLWQFHNLMLSRKRWRVRVQPTSPVTRRYANRRSLTCNVRSALRLELIGRAGFPVMPEKLTAVRCTPAGDRIVAFQDRQLGTLRG